MADTITLDLDSTSFRRRIRKLADDQIPRAMASAINKVAFEILDAEKAEALQAFSGATDRGKLFLSGRGAFRFDRATESNLEARIYPNKDRRGRGRRQQILEEHHRGAVITGKGDTRLAIRSQGLLAVPIGVARVARVKSGKVPKRYQPAVVLGHGGRGFVAGRSIRLRLGRGKRSRTVKLYALVPQAKLEQRFDFYRVARDTARRVFPGKIRRAFENIRT